MSKKSRFFKIEELVSRSTFAKYSDGAWQFFDQRAIDTLDCIKSLVAPRKVYVNDWFWNPSGSQYRGYRHQNEYKGGAVMSAHKEGKAFDISVDGWSDEELKRFIIDHQNQLPHPIRIEIENTNSKVHFDVRGFSTGEKIYFFKP